MAEFFELAFAGAAVLVILFSAIGALLAREPLDKLHFLAPVTSLAVPLFSIAAAIFFGISLGSASIVVTAAIVAFSGPAVTVAIARAIADDTGVDVGASPR